MRTIVHLSDLHFGRLDQRVVEPLIHAVGAAAPDLIAISGDLTQRARARQFAEARAFLESLHFPKLVVPGNHDIPLFNVALRLLRPFDRYQRFIRQDLEPFFLDSEMAVVGLNSARAYSIGRGGRGRLNPAQVSRAVDRLRPQALHLIKVIVTHHPFDLPEGYSAEHLVGRAHMAMAALASAGADLFLAGHLHVSHVGHTTERYKIAGHSALVVQAGTISTRGRGELNSFNVLRLARPRMTVERHTWDTEQQRFLTSWTGTFQHTDRGWSAVP